MNMSQLTEPPKDMTAYVECVSTGSFEKDTLNLRLLLQQATANIFLKEWPYALINDLEGVILEKQYKVLFIPPPDSTAFANFYLQKF